MSFPKSVFEQFNGFDESFKSYGWEDLELGYRLSLANVPLKYLPSAINYHYHVISKEDEITRCISKGESAKRFVAKHPKLKWFLGLNPISIFIFNQLKDDGRMVRFAKRCFDKSEGSFKSSIWFLVFKRISLFKWSVEAVVMTLRFSIFNLYLKLHLV